MKDGQISLVLVEEIYIYWEVGHTFQLYSIVHDMTILSCKLLYLLLLVMSSFRVPSSFWGEYFVAIVLDISFHVGVR